jgi:hypothetical protein
MRRAVELVELVERLRRGPRIGVHTDPVAERVGEDVNPRQIRTSLPDDVGSAPELLARAWWSRCRAAGYDRTR